MVKTRIEQGTLFVTLVVAIVVGLVPVWSACAPMSEPALSSSAAPVAVLQGVSRKDALEAKAQSEEARATVELAPSTRVPLPTKAGVLAGDGEYDVVIVDMGPRPAHVLKVCQDLKEPDRWPTVGCPTVVLQGVAEELAEEAQTLLEAEGATVSLEAPGYVPPKPEPPIDAPFLLPIEDVFSIKGRGTVVTGRVERGVVRARDKVEIIGIGDTRKTVVTGVELFQKTLDQGQAGNNVGVLLRGIDRDEVERGMVLAEPGSIATHTSFRADVYILTGDEGGRNTPFVNGFRPQFVLRTLDLTGVIELAEGTEMVMPGEVADLSVALIMPVALEEGQPFAMYEGGRTIGLGWVTQILD